MALKQAGHQVHLLTSAATRHNAVTHGVPASELPGDIKATLPFAEPEKELRRAQVIKAVRAGLLIVNDNALRWMSIIADHARNSDVVLYSGLSLVAAEAVTTALDKPAAAL